MMKLRWAEKLISRYIYEIDNGYVDLFGLCDNPTVIVNKNDYELGVRTGLKWANIILNETRGFYIEEHFRLWGKYPKGVQV